MHAASPPRTLTRWSASGIHLLISAAIAACAVAVMLLVWYPRPLFEAAGGSGLLFILVGVDVVIGPLITLIIYRAGKRGLRFDLCVIALLQLSALFYGTWVMFSARPVYLVFYRGQFDVVTAVEIRPEDRALARRAEFRSLPLDGPKYVFAEATDRERQDVFQAVLSGGAEIHQRPRYYVPLGERAQEALAQARTLADIRRRWPDMLPAIERYLSRSGREAGAVKFIPGRGPYGWLIAVLDAKTGAPEALLLQE